jgi:hypothetical protein
VFETTPKMLAKNYFADIMGISPEYALEAYDWQGFYPMTANGITVTGFWDSSKSVRRLRRLTKPQDKGPNLWRETI